MKLNKTTFNLLVTSFDKEESSRLAEQNALDALYADGVRSVMLRATIDGVENEALDAELVESVKLAFITSTAFGADKRALVNADVKVLTPGQKKERRTAMMRIGAAVYKKTQAMERREKAEEAEKDEKEFLKKINGYKTEAAKKRAINTREKQKAEAKKARNAKPAQTPEAAMVEYLTAAYNVAKKGNFAIAVNKKELLERINELLAEFEA